MLTICMIFAMLPMNVFAVDDETSVVADYGYHPDKENDLPNTFESKGNDNPTLPTNIPTGSHWESMGKVEIPDGEKCAKDMIYHPEHSIDCFTQNAYVIYVNDDGCKHWDTNARTHPSECVTVTEKQVPCDNSFHGFWCCNNTGTKTEKSYVIDKCTHIHTYDMSGSVKCYNYLECPAKKDALGNAAYTHVHTEPDCYTYTWTLKWNEYTVEWYKDVNGTKTLIDTNSKVQHGNAVEVPSVSITETQTLVWNPSISSGTTNITIAPANAKHQDTITYTATITDDKVYTVTYKVDGAVYVIDGEEQIFNVNATKGEKVPGVAAPTKADNVFAGWTNANMIGTVPTGNLVLEAQWEADINNNGKADNDGEIATVEVKVTNGTATLTSGHEKVKVTYNEANDKYVVVYDSVGGNYGVNLNATAKSGETANVAYYLDKELVDNNKVGTTFNVGSDTVITLTFSKEEFNLVQKEKYEIKINGFDNTTKAGNLKPLILNEVLGSGNYNADDYKVELKTVYDLGLLGKPEIYLNVEGGSFNILGREVNIPASWFVDQLKVDGTTANYFKITKLGKSNASGIDLYHEDVAVIASEIREKITADDIALGITDYTKNELSDVIDAIKGNVTVKGNDVEDKYVSVTLAPETALTTNKQTYTASVKVADTADFIADITKEFTIIADISVYTVTWVANGNTVDSETVAYGTSVTKSPSVPVQTGYTGVWSDVPAKITDNVTVTANYTINQYTITFVDYDDTVIDTLTQNYATDVTAPSAPTRTGYTFKAWSETVPATMPAKDMTIKATYEINVYEITWNAGEGKFADGRTEKVSEVEYNQKPEAPETPTKDSVFDADGNVITEYVFAGWTPSVPDVMPDDDTLSFTAVFVENVYVAYIADADGNRISYEKDFLEAASKVQDGQTIVLLADVELHTRFITGTHFGTKAVTIDGNGKRFYAGDPWGTGNGKHLINVNSDNITLKNVILDCNKIAEGVNIYKAQNITFDNVTIINKKGWNADLTVNGSTLTVKNKISANYIDVSLGKGVTTDLGIVAEDGAVFEVTTLQIASVAYPNTNLDGAKATDGTSYYTFKKLDANGDLAGYAKSISSLSNGYGYKLLEEARVTSNVTLLNAGHTGTLDLDGYTLTVADGKTLTVKGELTVTGGIDISSIALGDYSATIIADTGLNAVNGIADDVYGVVYDNGKYYLGTAITFVYGNGNADEVIYVRAGESLVAPVPTWTDHLFTGWDKEVVTVPSENATYTAQWVADINNNGVYDKDELISFTQSGNGQFNVTGVVWSDEFGAYVFDSSDPTITVTATPVVEGGYSKSYVVSIAGVGTGALTFGDGFVATLKPTVSNGDVVEIVFDDVPVVNSDNKVVVDYNFYTGEIPYGDIYNAVIVKPEIMDTPETKVEYKYFARPAMKHTVSIDTLDLDSSIKALLSTIGINEFSFDMKELWLPLDAKITDSVDLETAVSTYLTKERINALLAIYNAAHDKAYNDYIAANGSGLLDKAAAEAAGILAGGEAVKADIGDIYNSVYAAAMYYGAHNFGYNPTGADTVDEIIKIEYENAAMKWYADAAVTLRDPRESAFISGSDLELIYRDYTDEDILGAFGIVDKDGNVIDGSVYSVSLSDPYTFEGKNVSDTAYSLVIKFAGNEKYKAAEKTFAITIKKADASIDLPNVNITYGEAYDPTPDVTMGNKYGEAEEIVDSLVEIIIGLDINELKIAEDGKLDGLATHIQLLLPKDDTLANIFKTIGLDVYGKGVTLSLDELQGYLDQIGGLLEGFDSGSETIDSITNILNSVTGLVNASDIEITFGGKYPTDIGVYVYGAVSTSGNYETAFDVGYIFIKPDTTKVYLDWNYTDPNGIFTWELLKYIDLGATAFDDEAFTSANGAATEKVVTLFLGVDENGEVVFTADPTTLGNGAYIEMAFIYDFGNELYYAEPIVRPVVIVPNVVDVEIVDGNGEAKDTFEYEFDNTEKDHYVTVNGEKVSAVINYVGVMTNGKEYNSTTAPKHAGVYAAYVIYYQYNEAGELVAVGADVTSIVIAPNASTIDVTGGNVKYDGNGHTAEVVTGSADSELKPDYTLISGTVGVRGSIDEIGLGALYGTVNIDLPKWLDKALADTEAIKEGITPAYLIDFINSYRDEILAAVQELNVANIEAYIDQLVAVLAEIPVDVSITFKDDISYTMPGYYFFYGIVTDSDHYPSTDTGLLVIEKLDLEFELENTTLPYNGNEQFVDVTNPLGTDYVTVITDDKNNIANIILDGDMMYLIEKLEQLIGKEIPTSVELGDVYSAVSIEELTAAINSLLDEVEAIENLPAIAVEIIDWIRDQLATLPANGTVVINGKLPVEAGEYKVYAITYSEIYKSVVDGGTLTIAPIYVAVDDVENSKVYGEADPELEANVTYYSYKTVNGVVVKVAITELPDDIKLAYYVTREDGENVGKYAMSVEDATIIDSDNYVLEVAQDDTVFTITPAELTITVNSDSKTYGDSDPEFTYTVDITKGNATAEELGIVISRESGEDAGTYSISANYNVSDNYVVTVLDGTLTINKKSITAADVELDGSLIYNGSEQTQNVKLYNGVTADVSGNTGIDADSYTLTVNGNGNYTGSVILDWSIAKKTATIIANDKTIVVLEDVPNLDATVIGAVDGEVLDYTLSTDATSTKPAVFDIIVTLGDNPNYDITLQNGKLTVTLGDYVCWNTSTGLYYNDVTNALAAAVSGQTVELLVNRPVDAATKAAEQVVIVGQDVTLNLNGFYFEVGNLLSFGNVIDNNGTTDGIGGIVITNDRTKAFVQLQENNGAGLTEGITGYMPIYDAENECYRIFGYRTSMYKLVKISDNAVKFRYRVRFTNLTAYKLMSDAENSGLTVKAKVTWTNMGSDHMDYVAKAEDVSNFAEDAYEYNTTHNISAMDSTYTMTVTIIGLKEFESGTKLTSDLTVSSETGVSFTTAINTDNFDTYYV